MLQVQFGAAALPQSAALVLLVPQGSEPAGLHAVLERATEGAIGRALRGARFTGKKGETATLLAPGAGLDRVVAVGVGPLGELTAATVEAAAGTATALCLRDAAVAIAADAVPAWAAVHAGVGAALRAWRFDRYRTREAADEKPALERATVLTSEMDAAAEAWPRARAVLDGVALARELASEPANVLTPVAFAERCQALDRLGLQVEIFNRKDMEKLGFGALLGVAKGSAQKPRLVVLRWEGGAAGEKPLAFVGKGVTFDSGGISIKGAAGMEDMKWDMAGAGTVAGLMAALAGRKAPVNAVGLLGLVENMLSGEAQRPGDVVTTASGQTVEVLNTDAEGRLVLADVLHYAQDRFSPRAIVDLATLTGAIITALGHEFAGLFCNNDALAAQLLDAGRHAGEKLWRMPLDDSFDKLLASPIADMKNIGGRAGSAIVAAHFIKRFVAADTPWAHLDIAGTAWTEGGTATVPKGATAFGVRLLDRLVAEHYEQRD